MIGIVFFYLDCLYYRKEKSVEELPSDAKREHGEDLLILEDGCFESCNLLE